MPTYVALLNFTDQGIRNVRETTKRAKAFREMAEKSGAKVRDLFWTLGSYDLVTVVEAADAETLTALLLGAGTMGNVRSQTLRAFSSDEMDRILAKLPKT
jgi:uncharacterized protein with GYD domain